MSLKCSEYRKSFDDYCMKRLSESEKTAYETHADSCEYCQVELKTYRSTVSLVDSVNVVVFDDSFWAKQHEAICNAVAIVSESEAWVAPRYLLVLMLVMVGAYVIDGLGFLYVTGAVEQGGSYQFFDTSFVIYGVFAAIGIHSFVSDNKMEPVTVAREA